MTSKNLHERKVIDINTARKLSKILSSWADGLPRDQAPGLISHQLARHPEHKKFVSKWVDRRFK